MTLSGNIGEWSEIYIFLQLMYNRKIYAADINMKKRDSVYLNIIKIIREELRNNVYSYYTGDLVKILLNDEATGIELPDSLFKENRDKLFKLMKANKTGTFGDDGIEDFLKSIHVTKLKSPALSSNDFFGGTQDIIMSVMDYRTGITQIVGFSCKSDVKGRSSLFNASKDNTNFVFEITGPIDDELMDKVNSTFRIKHKTNKKTGIKEDKEEVAIGERIRVLKSAGCDVKFVSPVTDTSERNLVLSGGKELPQIIGEALKYFYWVGEASTAFSPFIGAMSYVADSNPAQYSFDDVKSIYNRKFSDLLYNMFTGMRLGTSWNGRSSVNGGYIIMKNDGDVLAYHSCIADEFKDFLLSRLGFETPSCSRHNYMNVYKEDGKYYIKFNLQVRFVVPPKIDDIES